MLPSHFHRKDSSLSHICTARTTIMTPTPQFLFDYNPLFTKFNDELKARGYYTDAQDIEQSRQAALKRFKHELAEQYKEQGNVFFGEGQSRKATHMYRAAIELAPDNAVYFSNLAGTYIQMADYANAEEACMSGLKKAKEGSAIQGKLFWRLARVYKEDPAKLGDALDTIEKALTIAPKDSKYQKVKKDIENKLKSR